MPLPKGWSATLARAYRDDSHAPPYRCLEFLFVGPSGAALRHTVRLPLPDTVGLNRQGMVNLAWAYMVQYVLSTINDLGTIPVVPPSDTINAQVGIP